MALMYARSASPIPPRMPSPQFCPQPLPCPPPRSRRQPPASYNRPQTHSRKGSHTTIPPELVGLPFHETGFSDAMRAAQAWVDDTSVDGKEESYARAMERREKAHSPRYRPPLQIPPAQTRGSSRPYSASPSIVHPPSRPHSPIIRSPPQPTRPPVPPLPPSAFRDGGKHLALRSPVHRKGNRGLVEGSKSATLSTAPSSSPVEPTTARSPKGEISASHTTSKRSLTRYLTIRPFRSLQDLKGESDGARRAR